MKKMILKVTSLFMAGVLAATVVWSLFGYMAAAMCLAVYGLLLEVGSIVGGKKKSDTNRMLPANSGRK